MLLIKVFTCVLLATVALAAEEEDSGQYNPELYEKPYETPEGEESTTETTEATSEAEEPAEPAEHKSGSPEVVVSPPVSAPKAEAVAPPVSPVLPTFAAIPYPLLYSAQRVAAPLVYSSPQFFGIAAAFPTVVL